MIKRILSLLLTVCMIMQMCSILVFAVDAENVLYSGTCGDNLTWTLEDGVLTISGEGAMYDYNMSDTPTPWYADSVEQVVFAEGCAVTSIGEHTFANCTQVTEIEIPDTVTEIGYGAFYGCESLTSVKFSDSLAVIDNYAFVSCTNLREITIPANVTFIGTRAFAFGALETVRMLGSEPELGDNVFQGCTITTYAPWITWVSDQWGTVVYNGDTDTPDNPKDETAPTITLVSPENESSVRGEAAFTVTASDDCGLSKIKMQRSGADDDIRTVSGTTATVSFVVDTTGMEEGSTLNLYFAAVDTSDNQTEIVCTFTVDNVDEPIDTIAPVITDFWPATDDGVTFCHDGTVQIAASDETALSRAEIWATIGSDDPIRVGEGFINAEGIYAIKCDFAALYGEAVLTYKVYDTAGNCTEETAVVTIRPYTAPAVPTNLTAEAGFRSAELSWEYSGDMATLKQFNIYDADGGMLVSAVKNYKFTIRELSETTTYQVAAEDIYGMQSLCEEITVTPILTENVAPKAVLPFSELTAVTGTPITFSGAGSTDNDCIDSYVWDFGDGSTGNGVNFSHTYTDEGTYTVTLTVKDRSGNSNNAEANVTVYDTLGEDATHAVLTVTVMDGYKENTPAIEGATVTVSNEDFEVAALTNSAGKAELVVPNGTHSMTVVKDGYGGKVQQIEIAGDANGTAVQTIYLAAAGVDVIGGELTVTPMTYDEIVEAGIDVADPANNHVVKQEFTIRFQPTPELQFDLPIEQLVDAAGDMLKGVGFGWHTFTPEPIDPDPSEPDRPNIVTPEDWGTPDNYTVGVFPVGDSAYMVIYGQTHWLKEMFNVELIVFNNSYAENITDCMAELQLPEGLSLANLLDRTQTESVYLGEIGHKGTANDSSARTVNWYVRGDAEGDYSLTAVVNGMVNGTPFEKTFTAKEAIHVFAGSALKLTVTLPESAYAENDYAVKFSLTNVSDRPIYNLSFGLDSAQQFVAERMSDGSVGEVEREFSNKDFEDGMTYGLPVLEPGKSFNLILKTNFAYEHQFIEWAVGKVPGLEVGYAVADIFVTTLEGSTTEIPVDIVLEDVEKDDLFQWVWDETIGALKENAKETVIEFIDDKVFQGIPVAEKGVEILEVATNIRDHFTEDEIEYTPTVNVTDGIICVPESEVDAYLDMFSTYSLRRNTAPGILVWTDADDAVISDDSKTMTMPSGGKLFVLRLGDTPVAPEIDVTTYYVDEDGKVQPFTSTLLAAESFDENGNPVGGTYTPGLKAAKHILMEDLTENSFEVPADGETTTIRFQVYLIDENSDILMQASNEIWSVLNAEGEEVTEGMTITNGVLVITNDAEAGEYTVKVALEDTNTSKTQTIVLTKDSSGCEHILTKTEATPASCTVDGSEAYWTCSECGNLYSDADGTAEITDLDAWKTGAGKIAAGHTYGELIEDQAEIHTQIELKGAVAAHYFCDVCDTYFTEGKAATTLNDLTGEVPEHTDGDSDHNCDVCGKTMGTCEDKNLDHACDYGCDKVYGEHKDTDKDHTCDYGCVVTIGACEDKDLDHSCDYGCDKDYGDHKDTDKDHACNYGCSETIGICEDKNLDHACDYGCDKVYGEHKAASAKHTCDYCGAAMSECSDGNDADHDCDICGAENITNHSFSNIWSYDKDTHWHDSACGHNVISDEAAHVYGNNRTCDVCGYTKPNNVIMPVFPINPPHRDDTETDSDVPDTEIPWQNPFTDVDESDWFYEDVKYMSDNGLMLGTNSDETLFSPDATLTRAMLVTVLWRLEGEPVVNYLISFNDVESEQWYTEAIRWAASVGIVNGYGNGTFGINDAVTREQIMAILHRYAAYNGLDNGMIFPMIPQYEYSIWSENDIIWADMVGLTDGIGMDIFDMTEDATRAEIAAYLRRFCERIDAE